MLLPADRARVRDDAPLGHAAPLGGRAGVRRHARLVRSAVAGAPHGLSARERQAEFEVNMRTPEGTSLAETRLIAERIADDIRKLPGVARTLVTVGDGQQSTRTSRAFTSSSSIRRIATESSQDHGASPARGRPRTSRARSASTCRSTSQISSGRSNAGIQYTLSGPDLRRLDEYTKQAHRAAQEGARRGGRRLQPHRRQARGARRRRSRARRQPRRAGRRRRQHAAAADRRSQGLDLRRGGRGVRHRRSRRGELPRRQRARWRR